MLVDGELHTIVDSHINFDKIIDELRSSSASTQKLKQLIDVRKSIEYTYLQLTELVEIKNDRIYFDNEPADEAISSAIMQGMQSSNEEDSVALARFLERLASNPSNHSKEQLYNWLRDRNFSITEDGMLIGYKGVRSDFTSKFSGKAVIDGRDVEGHIPNRPNTTISMGRSEVTFDPNVACAYGLHVGTYSYASSWAGSGRTLAVLVNPRDVVSVPTDCQAQKMRVSRYRVLHEVDGPINSFVLLSDEMKERDENYDPDFDWYSEEDEFEYGEHENGWLY